MTGLERLEVACDWVESVPAVQFDFCSLWARLTPYGHFIGCFVGNATRCPALAAEGLRLEYDGHGYAPVVDVGERKVESWGAVYRFFNLNRDEAVWLLMPLSYPNHVRTSRAEVVARVREFVADRKALGRVMAAIG